MMDVTRYLDVRPAPCAVFDLLDERRDRPRFHRRGAGGVWEAVTWGRFAEEIRRVALFLAESGFGPGDRAVVFAPNRVEWGAAALGIQAAGGAMVPIYPASTTEQAAYVIDHSDARFVFVDTPALLARALAATAGRTQVERIVLLDDLDPAAALAAIPAADRPDAAALEQRVVRWSRLLEIGADVERVRPGAFDERLAAVSLGDVGMMLYTSGTSGNPKGVPLTHENVGVNARDWMMSFAPILPEDGVDLLWLPMSHIFGWGELCLGNALGFESYLAAPSEALALLPEIAPTVFMSVPAYWEKLAHGPLAAAEPEERRRLLHAATGGRLRFCLSGGAGLDRAVKEVFCEAGVLLIEGYGLTETSPTLTINRPDDYRFDSVGKPLPTVELRLADDGEILARGASVFAGYHKDPQATAEAFTDDGWFKTGDVGRFTEDGFLQIVDRKKDILVTAGGKNVPPANIELRFRDDPLISHLVVYGDGKKYLVAGVWIDREVAAAELAGDLTEGALRRLVGARIDRVNDSLARFETIKKFCVIDTPLTVEGGLLTASLKLRRKKVYETFRDRFEALYDEPAPARPEAPPPAVQR